jgi:hypothetical protein
MGKQTSEKLKKETVDVETTENRTGTSSLNEPSAALTSEDVGMEESDRTTTTR